MYLWSQLPSAFGTVVLVAYTIPTLIDAERHETTGMNAQKLPSTLQSHAPTLTRFFWVIIK